MEEKNVGSVDLDELKRAREELNQERGIETDPHMYDNYNPDRDKTEQESSAEDEKTEKVEITEDISSEFDAESTESSTDEKLQDEGTDASVELSDSEEKNFDAYDSFADFEVKENMPDDDNFVDADEPLKSEDENQEDAVKFTDENEDDFVIDSLTDDTDNVDTATIADSFSDDDDKNSEDSDIEENSSSNTDDDLSDESSSQADENNLSELDSLKSFEIENNSDEKTDISSTEVINDLKKLNEMLEEDDKKTEELERLAEEKNIEKKKKQFKFINSFEFIETIATGDFKNSDNLSFILGKNEDNKIIYANFRDIYNVAIFGTDKDKIYEFFSSVILSLSLKNTNEDINFVICDSKAASRYDDFEKSSFMYYNRVAKTNKEIIDSLVELVKELERRYEVLVEFDCKSIEAYQKIAKENGLATMPYILTIFNNYTKSSQLADANKINNCLINILKLGRIVGMYLFLSADFEIPNSDLNLNFPSRITFKAQNEADSISAIGEVNAEWLDTDGDILFYNIFDRAPKHLKIAHISKDEVKLIIENIEN